MDTLTAWLALSFLYLGPLLHVLVSPRFGSWRPPAESRCPLGPRAGWLVMVLMLGILGWLLFWIRPKRRGRSNLSS